MPTIAQRIETATSTLAECACEVADVSDEEWDEPEFTMISMGLTAPRDVIAVGTTCLEAIDGLLPYPPPIPTWTMPVMDWFFQQSPLLSMLQMGDQPVMSGGTELFSLLIYAPPEPPPLVAHYLDMPVIIEPTPVKGLEPIMGSYTTGVDWSSGKDYSAITTVRTGQSPLSFSGMPVVVSPYVPKGMVRMIGSTVYANDVQDVVDAVKIANSDAFGPDSSSPPR
jgi:hypothetical protein